jgi:hypothetical protein
MTLLRGLSGTEYFGVLWLISTSVFVGFSVYAATRKPNQINLALAIAAPLMGMLGYAVAFAFPGRLYAELYPWRDISTAMMFILAALGIAAMWADAILIQVLQNAGYRMVGAPVQPIRWHSASRPRRKVRPSS